MQLETKTNLTRHEVAEYLRVSPRTVYTLMYEHNLPHYKTGKGGRTSKVLFPREAVDAWQAERAAKSRPLTPVRTDVRTRPRRRNG